MVTHMVNHEPSQEPTGNDADTLDRGQVAALLELLREAVARARCVAVDATLHGLCGDQGVNEAGIRWASERIAEEPVDPGPAAAAVAALALGQVPGANSGPGAMVVTTRPHDWQGEP